MPSWCRPPSHRWRYGTRPPARRRYRLAIGRPCRRDEERTRLEEATLDRSGCPHLGTVSPGCSVWPLERMPSGFPCGTVLSRTQIYETVALSRMDRGYEGSPVRGGGGPPTWVAALVTLAAVYAMAAGTTTLVGWASE